MAPNAAGPIAAVDGRCPWRPLRNRSRSRADIASPPCWCAGSRARAAALAGTAGSGRPGNAARSPPMHRLPLLRLIPSCRRSCDFRPDLFREHLHLIEQLGDAVRGEEQAEEMRHASFAQRHSACNHAVDAADQIDVLRVDRSLTAQRRSLQRLEVLKHLTLAEARHGLLLIAAEMHDV